tara:strand:- start:6236 stop:6832 length:597 start_codon:yes stop_codon:yes gene_type:complete
MVEFEKGLRQRLLKPLTQMLPIYIHIPKTGGQYLKKQLVKNNIIISKAVHTPAKLVREMVGEQYRKRFTFAMVRNPYERFLSACRFNGVEDIEGLSESILKGKRLEVKHREHFFTQKHFVTDDKGIIVNYIGKYEKFEEFVQELNKNKIDLTRTHITKPNKSSNWEFILTEKTKRNVEEIYKEDFELFNYQIKNIKIK